MGDLLIRNIPDAMKAELEQRARQNGRSLSDEAKVQIRRSLATVEAPEPRQFANALEALRSAFEEAGPLDDEYSRIMDEIEAQRKKDFGRPLPDFE